ncbi:MAG: GPW/gp25 family protein [Alphaproteobacteria bacterium]|nr:GPW/gp25 family protein [Alphaproteobacteria bacterium]
MRVDRSFLDKFHSSTYIQNKKEFGESIIAEVYNILSTRIKSHINMDKFKGTNENPFDYGILDLQSFDNVEQLSENIKQCIIFHEPRIKECYIENININPKQQSIEFNILFTIDNYSECFKSNINIRY